MCALFTHGRLHTDFCQFQYVMSYAVLVVRIVPYSLHQRLLSFPLSDRFCKRTNISNNAIFRTFTVPYSAVPVFYTSLCAWVILKQMGFKHPPKCDQVQCPADGLPLAKCSKALDWQNSILSVFQIWCVVVCDDRSW